MTHNDCKKVKHFFLKKFHCALKILFSFGPSAEF